MGSGDEEFVEGDVLQLPVEFGSDFGGVQVAAPADLGAVGSVAVPATVVVAEGVYPAVFHRL